MKCAADNNSHNVQKPEGKTNFGSTISIRTICTSRSAVGLQLVSELRDANKIQRITLDESTAFFSVMDPEAMVSWEANPKHNGIWFVLTGSIRHAKYTLASGDWIFIPKGKRCSVTVGPEGATAYYCHCGITGSDNVDTAGRDEDTSANKHE